MAYKARAQQIDIPEISCQAADLSVGNRRKYLLQVNAWVFITWYQSGKHFEMSYVLHTNNIF